jgi:ABC-type transport system involved in multi-copper enzyme maturation permease subunit
MFDLRLIGADALKLRRRRGMLALCVSLTLGLVTLMVIVAAIRHTGNPVTQPPAGGVMAYRDMMSALTLMMLVVGAIIGATAGAQDLESGLFRDLAATGRSRLALFGARVPGAWTIVLPIAGLAAAGAAIAALTLAGGVPAPDAATIVAATAGVLTAGALSAAVAVGLAALTGSRASVITVMLAFNLALAPLLSNIAWLGDGRQAIPTNALSRIGEGPDLGVHMGLVTAIVVILAWAAAAFAAGAWRTQAREI